MSMIAYHPAPGLGLMLPGWFVVPNNPLQARQAVAYQPTLGEIMPARFVVPENPLLRALSLGAAPKCLCSSMGCGMGCPTHGMAGLPEVWEQVKGTATGVWNTVTGAVTGAVSGVTGLGNWTTYALLGGGALVLYMVFARGGGYRSAARKARQEYRAKIAGLKQQHGRRYKRFAEAY